ncbi:MAG: carbon storage regulator CsrA [Acidaminobacteraceae bacterium]
MLVLSRKKDESLIIGDNIEITIVEIEDGRVKIGIEAPKSIEVNRKEVYDKIMEENKSATMKTHNLSELKKLMKKDE